MWDTWKYLSKVDLAIKFLRWHAGMSDGKSGFITILLGWAVQCRLLILTRFTFCGG